MRAAPLSRGLALAALLLSGCSGSGKAGGEGAAAPPSLLPAGRSPARRVVTEGYADPAVCGGCHRTIAESYSQVAMSRSFSLPAIDNVIEDYSRKNRLEHDASGFTYEMRQDGGRFFQKRFEVDASGRKDKSFEREVTFIIGSGRHARSYLNRGPGGEMTMLPVTWYTQEKKWGMSPGFDRRDHFDFFRPVNYFCIFCHTGYPAVPADSDPATALSVFPATMPTGIDCQRCHGPGARHAALAGRSDSSFQEVRAAIVNPRRLPPERQMDVCMQCHLETTSDGNWSALIVFGRGVFSFRPGEDLSGYRIHFDEAPGTGHDDKFEIAHQAYRLRQARCFRESAGRLTCLTCHDPHRRPEDPKAFFSSKCLGCHKPDDCGPTRLAAARGGAGPCVVCHMPQRRTDDVVHVRMTDHRIGVHPSPDLLLAPKAEAQGPYRGAIVYYRPEETPKGPEKDLYLGIANVLDGVNLPGGGPMLMKAVASLRPRAPEPYLALGIALMSRHRFKEAIQSLGEAARLDPRNPRILMTLGNALAAGGQLEGALRRYDEALVAWPAYSEAETNAGNLLFQSGRIDEALGRYDRAIALRPDNAEAYSNRGAVLVSLGRLDEAIEALREALRIDPRHAEGYENLGVALERSGRSDEALRVLRDGHREAPKDAGVLARLAFILATTARASLRNGREATNLAEEAVRLTGRQDARSLDALAAALAESGDPARAVGVADEAERLASTSGQADLQAAIRERRQIYARGAPYREK